MEKKINDTELTKYIQQDGLEILSFFSNYAKENNITYYMAGGTLLGAVRHKGFIPWDDDMDIMIPRNDYERLIKTFSNQRYCLTCCENDCDYNMPFARLWDVKTTLKWNIAKDKNIGVFVDFFPMDGFPDGNIKSKIHVLRIKILRVLLNSSIRIDFSEGERFKLVKRLIKFCFHRDGNYYAKRINTIAKKYDYLKCNYVGVKTTTDHLFRERNSKKIFEKTIWLQFEKLILPAPSGYDTYLRHLYGDYMQLPSVDERHTKHQFTVTFNAIEN